MSHTELKSLETRRRKVKENLNVRKTEQVSLSREINQLIRNVKDIEGQIELLKVNKVNKNSIIITEHAILRYLERVEGVDIERVKKDILDDKVLRQIKTLGTGYYPCTKRFEAWKNREDMPFRIRVRDNSVVTVLTKEHSDK